MGPERSWEIQIRHIPSQSATSVIMGLVKSILRSQPDSSGRPSLFSSFHVLLVDPQKKGSSSRWFYPEQIQAVGVTDSSRTHLLNVSLSARVLEGKSAKKQEVKGEPIPEFPTCATVWPDPEQKPNRARSRSAPGLTHSPGLTNPVGLLRCSKYKPCALSSNPGCTSRLSSPTLDCYNQRWHDGTGQGRMECHPALSQ